MTVKTYALLDPTGLVLNTVLWDGVAHYDVSPNHLVVADATAQIGGTYANGVFTPAPPPQVI